MKKSILSILLILLTVICIGGMGACNPTEKPETFTVTFDLGDYEGGTAPDAITVESGQSVTLTEVSRTGYDFLGWSDGENVYKAGTSYTVTKNVTLVARWQVKQEPAKPQFTVTLVFEETDGTITLSPSNENNVYTEDTTVTVTVTPKPGRKISTFKVDGKVETLSDKSTYALTVKADTTVEALFEKVLMDTEAFSSLTGNISFEGTGEGVRVYEGYDDYQINEKNTFKTQFGTDATLRFKQDNSYNLILYSNVYRNEDGKAVCYTRKSDNTVEKKATDESFDSYRNPFGTVVRASDFLAVGGNRYDIEDLEKASLAAYALTGIRENIALFSLFTSEGQVQTVTFSTERDQHGEGVNIDYTYYTDYVFNVTQGDVSLESYFQPYDESEDHSALKNALQSAEAAESYTIRTKEDWGRGEVYNYDVYVTENAYWCEDESDPYGFAFKDGFVYIISLVDEKLVFGEVLQMDGMNEDGSYNEYHDVKDMGEISAHFARIVPSIFEAQGDGVFELREQDSILAPDLAQLFYDGNDKTTMLYAKGIKITVENETLKEIEISCTMLSYEFSLTFTYSDWNNTKLPYPFENEEEKPSESDIPEKFYGVYAGDYTDFSSSSTSHYVVNISANGIKVTIDGEEATVEDVLYNAAQDNFSLKLNGKDYTLENYDMEEGNESVQEINLSGPSWNDPSVRCTRQS